MPSPSTLAIVLVAACILAIVATCSVTFGVVAAAAAERRRRRVRGPPAPGALLGGCNCGRKFGGPQLTAADRLRDRQVSVVLTPPDAGPDSPQMTLTRVSERPRIVIIDNFVDADEARALIEAAEPHFAPSTVAGGKRSGARTSYTAFLGTAQGLSDGDQGLVDRIVRRASVLSTYPADHFEPLQVVRYSRGQRYEPHFDYFSADSPELRRGGNRRETFFLYLNDVPAEEGGETEFPRVGVKFRPKLGTAIFWNNALPDGSPDSLTFHGGSPPTGDTVKYAVNIWVREAPYRR